jgi:uroporphyrinogen decarboxylase
LDIGSQAATGINVTAYLRLKRLLGLAVEDVHVYDVFGMMARIESDVIEHFGADAMLVPALCPRFDIPIKEWKPWRLPDGTPVQVPLGFQAVPDADGGLLLMVDGEAVGKMPAEGHYFSELAVSFMGGLDSLEDPPDPDEVTFPLLSDEDLRFRQDVAQNLYEATDKALVFDLADNLRWNTSIANWLYAVAADPGRVYELHEKKSLNFIARLKQLKEALGPYVNVFVVYQDLGTQRGEMISPEAFEALMVPHYRRMYEWVHQHTDWKTFFHSCGSIYYLIPHLIAMGVDILNPVQCRAARMEPWRLKEEFGDRLVFWGGGTDTQTVLPFGTPEEVRQQVVERILTFGPGGGFVFGTTQDIQAEVPPENVLAMFEAVRERGRYPLQAGD